MTEKEKVLKDIRDELDLTTQQARKLLGTRPSLRVLKNVQRVLGAMSWSNWSNNQIRTWLVTPNQSLLSRKPIVLARSDDGMKTLLNYLQGKRRKHDENERDADRPSGLTQRGQNEAAAVMANIYYYGRR